jgi:hypothetical protein
VNAGCSSLSRWSSSWPRPSWRGTTWRLLLPAQCCANGVQNAESDRDAGDDEPESHQLTSQLLDGVHAQILAAKGGT